MSELLANPPKALSLNLSGEKEKDVLQRLRPCNTHWGIVLMMQNMDYSRYLPTEETDEIVSIHSKVHCALERINKEAVLGCSGNQFAVGRICTHERCRRTRGLH